MIIAIAALAIPATFFRPDAHNDPPYLSVLYGAAIVAGLVQLLIYVISTFSFPISPDESQRTADRDDLARRRREGKRAEPRDDHRTYDPNRNVHDRDSGPPDGTRPGLGFHVGTHENVSWTGRSSDGVG
jgi:hypothetical protein